MKKLEVIMLPVADQQKAKEFYLTLGFELLVEAPMGNGETWLQLGLPGAETSISLARFNGVVIETADIENEAAGLRAKGITVEKVDDTPWGRFAWLKDLDGNGLCLHQA